MESLRRPLIAIVGQTASGKSDLAMKLARKYSGEIIAADSRTIYRGMDIGTAKPSLQDQKTIPHHGLDLVEPNQVFSAAQFKRYADQVIGDIQKKGRVSLLVGGAGLYVDGFLYDFEFSNKADPELRRKLEQMSSEELQKRAQKLGISEEAVNFKNRRHLSRAIERGGVIRSRKPLLDNVLVVGVEIDKESLEQRIESRIEQMLDQGFEGEVQKLLAKYGKSAPGLSASGYKEFSEYVDGKISLEEAKSSFIRSHKQLARRQKTWFQRNPDIVWVQSFEQAEKLVSNFLRKFDTIEE